MNKMLEIEQSLLLINNNLSDHLTELAKLNSISKEEAETKLSEYLANNKKLFEETSYKLAAEQAPQGSSEEKQPNYTKDFKGKAKK